MRYLLTLKVEILMNLIKPILLGIAIMSLSFNTMASVVYDYGNSPDKLKHKIKKSLRIASNPYPFQQNYEACKDAAPGECQITVMISSGIHISGTDNKKHFTVRFTGAEAPYSACHFYPTHPNIINNYDMMGVQCFNNQHVPTPYCSYNKGKCGD